MSLLSHRVVAATLPLLFVATAVAGGKRAQPAVVDISQYDFREGDVLLQHFASKLGSVIADVTDSQYSHCGIVLRRDDQPYVIVAIGTVRIVPVANCISQ